MDEVIDGLHVTTEKGDVKVTNPDTQSTLYLCEEELKILLKQIQ